MKIPSTLKRLKMLILHILFTTRCPCCGKLLDFGKYICDECRGKIIPLKSPVCHRCGKSLNDHDALGCATADYEVIAAYYYGGEVRRLIIDFKDNRLSDNFEIFREAVIDKIAAEYASVDFDMTVCVPSYGKVKYSSSREMAMNIAQSFNLSFNDVLEKYRETQKQHRLSQKERFVNLKNSIRVKADRSEEIKGKTLLLCDDVKTTGATLNECAKALYDCGAKKVCCVCIAVSDYGISQREKEMIKY